ncbi:hypothetical protein HRbin02_00630 [Candidatus Calditenuaceae archaeon HR02]|nr:hypothetical protein HRbin02_00630 [Candidatus Calditenuaceae archaeon HR02]
MMRFYCDVHRKRDDSGYRITYTMDGEDFRHVNSPLEIPAGPETNCSWILSRKFIRMVLLSFLGGVSRYTASDA